MGLAGPDGQEIELDDDGKTFWAGFLIAGGHVTAAEWNTMPLKIRKFLTKFSDDLATKRAQDVGMAVAYAIFKTMSPKDKPENGSSPEKEAARAALDEAAGRTT